MSDLRTIFFVFFKDELAHKNVADKAVFFAKFRSISGIFCLLLQLIMQYLWQHIKNVFSTYNGEVPLTHFLKSYCKQYPILGSRDRRLLSTVVYSWYRCSKGVESNDTATGLELEYKLKACLEICKVDDPSLPKLLGKLLVADAGFAYDESLIFPGDIQLSEGITMPDWLHSMTRQPHLFIRIRKDKEKIRKTLEAEHIPYSFISASCLSLPNGAKIDSMLPADSFVVQDASSQRTGDYFEPRPGEQWYDCCTGAGGKALLLTDKCPAAKLTVTDRRASILSNLKARFRTYGLPLPKSFVADASDQNATDAITGGKSFDHIICDAPCTGSGTWSRTPEQMYFFDSHSISEFSKLQAAIAINVSRHLKKGGRLYYITCSVFMAENEDVVSAIREQTALNLVSQTLINGISQGADNMFVAILEK